MCVDTRAWLELLSVCDSGAANLSLTAADSGVLIIPALPTADGSGALRRL